MKRILIISSLFLGIFLACSSQTKHLGVGDLAPLFSLRDQNDSTFNIAGYLGKKILVIYFYPKDESSVCTKEACSFRDSYGDFTKSGTIVIGINSGTVESHKKFRENHHLPFTLLSDPGNIVLKMFGVKSKFVFTGRETFVIDKSCKIIFTYNSFTNGPRHEQEALTFIKNMQP